MAAQRLNKLAKLLVNYSTQVKPGDFVFISCDEVASPWSRWNNYFQFPRNIYG